MTAASARPGSGAAGGAGKAGDYGKLPTIYARATAFLVGELMRRGMTQEAAEQHALGVILAQAAKMKAALDGNADAGKGQG